MHRTKWQGCYRLYKSLEASWKWNNAPYEFNEQSFRETLTNSKVPSLITKEMQRWGYGTQDKDQWEIALKLRKVIRGLPAGSSSKEPLEDVYQAALRMETFHTWKTLD
jgi:hypothetical protein